MSALAEILSSRVRAEIFRILFGTVDAELHMREIARRSGCAIGTIQSEFKKLLRLDLVQKRRDGNRLYFRANRQNPLYPEIHGLVLKTSGLVDLLREALAQTAAIQIAFVFGSVARGEEQAESDVDLLIIGDLGLRDVTRLLAGLSEKISREINPHVMPPEEFRRRKQTKAHFITRVMAAPKIFIIGDKNGLEAMG
jgi:predicted nucleotidyltransferase